MRSKLVERSEAEGHTVEAGLHLPFDADDGMFIASNMVAQNMYAFVPVKREVGSLIHADSHAHTQMSQPNLECRGCESIKTLRRRITAESKISRLTNVERQLG
jgi:hypothetical protein